MRHERPAADSASNRLPCSKPNPSMVIHSAICAMLGLWSSPPEEAAIMKNRLGQVGPGMEARQPSHTANSAASPVSTGSCAGPKHCMISPGALPPAEPAYAATYPLLLTGG